MAVHRHRTRERPHRQRGVLHALRLRHHVEQSHWTVSGPDLLFFLTLWWFLSNKISLKSLSFSLSSSSHTSEHRAAQALFSNFSFIFKSCLIVGGLYKSELSCYNNRLLWLVNRIIVNIFFYNYVIKKIFFYTYNNTHNLS